MLPDILRIQKEWANNFTAVKERETDYTACEDQQESDSRMEDGRVFRLVTVT
jgi:hypothetical protein